MISPTFYLIKVKEIKNNIYFLDNGGLRAVLNVGGLNLSLLSEKEQKIVISQFKNFLDGLEFPVEILILSRLENISDYLKILHLRLEQETEPLIKFQLEEYISFLEDYLQNHKIMKKIFYVVVPYDEVNIGLGKIRKINEEELEVKINQLEIRVSYVEESLSAIGLLTERLTDQELIKLLFELYNPNLRWGQVPNKIIEKLSESI
ncbi:MAG: hypothetical protein KatS3mg093_101 [Candidatus Parcubacteria bacterium]|nr:MAG: hypothetical protein KatS3mg093_101 [Candidatus Parcubacteria bacterium]